MTGIFNNSVQESVSLLGDTPRVSPIHDDIFAYKNVTTQNLLEHEEHDEHAELIAFATKWFDYRELTPLQATRQYIDVFGEIHRKFYRTNFDAHAAKFIKVISVDQIWEDMARERSLVKEKGPKSAANKAISKAKRNFNACWRGRLVADHLGMPYDVFLDAAFGIRLRYWNGANMPQPQHLYLDWIIEKVAERWEELQAARLYVSHDPAYLVHNYIGVRHQDDYHEWLFKQANLRANPPMFMAQFVNQDMLPLEKVRARLDDVRFELVERHLIR